MAKLSVELNRYFFEEERKPEVTLAEILSLAGERIFGFLFVILSLPSALPIPAPGYSVPFGILMLLLALQLIFGRQRPWVPEKMQNSSISLDKVQGVLKAGLPWLQRIENITKPRLAYICTSLPGRVILGSAIALMSISMMIPVPLTNTIPAAGIFITAFGLLEDDGLICIGGLFVCSVGATVSISVLAFGVTAVRATIDLIKDWVGSLIS
ncbi:MAG: exopolysaccharide biosynthesis protein [Xenococcaceae cyanobacterium MO_188.B32]|nr:exopolysaccharide biosynthesis protein [Xenococcaceae cyanobacterium MO_188.B32]